MPHHPGRFATLPLRREGTESPADGIRRRPDARPLPSRREDRRGRSSRASRSAGRSSSDGHRGSTSRRRKTASWSCSRWTTSGISPGSWWSKTDSRSSIMRLADIRPALFASLAALLSMTPMPCQEDHAHHHGSPEALGTVRFQVSCSPEAQQEFNQASALLHSFWYDEAEKAFTRVAAADPRCGMAYWGVAMTRYHPIWAPPGPDDLKAGMAALEKAKTIGTGTEREKDFIGALAVFYKDSEKVDHLTRAVAYEKAMQRVYERYPQDHEAGIFYALAILGRSVPTDKTYAQQKRAAEILNRI